ncbi:prepilin-type N-terminal cleavage/methylation domain-containing protein [Clostridium sp. MSJ-11]|uniref:Prepilin-type N-terminal cleavage/methylation domain-containing protein n=1 Tax=Clostridium mobile TaxID=2841512 RepID=A0ABS6ECP1_9CLOT|nr:prepilin-type N-terminal cleavage/methylation domain-containing protein [Clostridium mobile]MBU5482957.1 prepilin-type N-terminal cleavage/methylation domain-containing protein [Clostridium mobile]
MFKSNKRAFSLIEVAISISLFTILFISSSLVTMNYLRLKDYNSNFKNSIYFLEGLKNILEYNNCVEDIEAINNISPVYFYGEDMNVKSLKEGSLYSLSKLELPTDETAYILLDIVKQENENHVYEIKILYIHGDKLYEYKFMKEWKAL